MSHDEPYFRVVHRRDKIRNLLVRWSEQYSRYKPFERIGLKRELISDIRPRIEALDLDTATVSDVDTAVGTPGWAAMTCDACGKDVDAIMRIGDEPDYEARYIDLCVDCLSHAAAIKVEPKP